MGSDRISRWWQNIPALGIAWMDDEIETPFELADPVWLCFQDRICKFVNENDGECEVMEKVAVDPYWIGIEAILKNEMPITDLPCFK